MQSQEPVLMPDVEPGMAMVGNP